MGHWGWRRLLAVFISVWVVGCTITQNAAPTISPTQLPKVTLTPYLDLSPTPQSTPLISLAEPVQATSTPVAYTVQPGDTLLQIALRFGVDLALLQAANGGIEPRTMQIGQQLTIPGPIFDAGGRPILSTATPLALDIAPPNCYATPTDHILCLGQVTNPLSIAIQRVTLLVRLIRPDGSLLAEGEASIEQSLIPPGGNAPYRVLLPADWRDYAGATVRLQSADSALDAGARYIALDVVNQERRLAAGHYTIRAVLHNPDSQPAQLYRAVVTLTDAAGQITGYRVVQLDRLLTADESVPFEIAVMPQASGTTTQHRLYIEAGRATPVTPG